MGSNWPRPTVEQIVAQLKAGYQAKLTGADLALRRSNLGVSAIVAGAALDGEYAYQDWTIDAALMPDTAVAPYSNRWGALKGISPKGPSAATGSVSFAGGIPGAAAGAGAMTLQLAPGVTYANTAAVTLDGSGNGSVAIQALLPSATSDGSQWNVDAGATLTLVQAIDGFPGAATVLATIDNGTAPETNTAFQQRYLQLYRAPPQGGDQNDYIEWAKSVPIVTRAWCIPLYMGAGTVAVPFMCDISEAGHGGFPQGTNGVATDETRASAATGDQLTVANAIFPLRPVTALVYALAPIAAPQNFTLKYVPNAMQSAVEAAIGAVLTAEGQADGTTSIDPDDIRAAIRALAGCGQAQMQIPNDVITVPVLQLPTVGTCTFL